MSVFANRTKKTITVDDLTVTIQKLSGWQLDEAMVARQADGARRAKNLGPELFTALQAMPKRVMEPTDEPKPVDPEARYDKYDRNTTVKFGIVNWDATDETGKPMDPASNVSGLDKAAREVIFRAIVDLSDPEVTTGPKVA